MDGLHIREGGQHHLHFGRFEDPGIVLHVAVVHLDIRLGEEAEDLRQQVALGRGQLFVPVLHVIGQRHFLGQPVDALLGQPGFVGPGITEGLVDRVFGEEVELFGRFSLIIVALGPEIEIGASRLIATRGVAGAHWGGPRP